MPADHPPINVGDVSAFAVDALLGGSFGWLHIPPGGNMDVAWRPRRGCYTLTVDLSAGHPLTPGEAEAFNAETLRRLREREDSDAG